MLSADKELRMSDSIVRATALMFVFLVTMGFVSAGDKDEQVAKLEATVLRQQELITKLRAQLAHERTADILKYEAANNTPVRASQFTKGSLWSGVDSQGGMVTFRVVSALGSDVFLESTGRVQDRLLLRFTFAGQNLHLRSVWLKGVDSREMHYTGSGVVTGSTADLKFSYTYKGTTKDLAVSLTNEVMISDDSR
ncbi:MAG: hypothetical protein ACKPJJ_30680 [Planctomycetaceae bacterium]